MPLSPEQAQLSTNDAVKNNDAVKKSEDCSRCKEEVVVIEKPCDKPGGVSNADKWIIAAILALIFAFLASTIAFGVTNWFFKRIGIPTQNKHGKPTIAGLIIHGILFFIIVRLLMH